MRPALQGLPLSVMRTVRTDWRKILSKLFIVIRCITQHHHHPTTLLPRPPTKKKSRNLGFGQFLDSGTKVGKTCPPPNKKLPFKKYGNLLFGVFYSGTSVGNPPPPHAHSSPRNMGNCDFVSFGIRNKSWKTYPPPFSIHELLLPHLTKIWDFVSFALREKLENLPPPSQYAIHWYVTIL